MLNEQTCTVGPQFEIINIYDGGIENVQGKSMGKIIFRISAKEGTSQDLIGYCLPNYRDSIIKNLRRLNFKVKREAGRDHRLLYY